MSEWGKAVNSSTFSKCQIFTPSSVACTLLDLVGYKNNLFGKKVLENTCGDGGILKEIINRYISDCYISGLSREEIKIGLETDIIGIEIDVAHLNACRCHLDNLSARYGLEDIEWQLFQADALKFNYEQKFDYIIGNPPYIMYRDLDPSIRAFVRENFSVCVVGKFDYCYAFVELAILLLKDGGKLGYILPSNIFKNVFGQKLRDFLIPHIDTIQEYKTNKLFPKILTASSILICDKNNGSELIKYIDVSQKKEVEILKSELTGKWQFVVKRNIKTLVNEGANWARFGDYFIARISVATLLNNVFVLREYSIDENFVYVGDQKIEKRLVRRAASPRSEGYGKSELIIFPFDTLNGKMIRYDEKQFKQAFPYATGYFNTFRKELDARTADKGVSWYEYGRSQALNHINQRKLLLSTVITNKVRLYELKKETVPYSGIFITMKTKVSLRHAKAILESEDFYEYVKQIGTQVSGLSIRITPSDIENYIFNKNEVFHA